MNVSPHWQPNTQAEKVARIQSLAERFEPDDIAAMLHIPRAEVAAALEGMTRAKWWVRNNKTNKVIIAMSKRGAYLRVCLLGWVDWDWGKGEVGQGVQP